MIQIKVIKGVLVGNQAVLRSIVNVFKQALHAINFASVWIGKFFIYEVKIVTL